MGGGGDDSDIPGEPEQKGILIRWQGWQERVAADPSFPYKVFIEQVGFLKTFKLRYRNAACYYTIR